MLRFSNFVLASVCGGMLATAGTVHAAGLILNEANCVGSQKWLGNPGNPSGSCPSPDGPGGATCANNEDVFFGRALGNGGDWIEFIVTTDHLDIRGWKLYWAETDNIPPNGGATHPNGTDIWYGNGAVEQGIITFSNDPLLADLRIGTILTITEKNSKRGGLDTDLTFDPCAGDWWINLNSFDAQFLTTQSNVLDENAVPPYSQTVPAGSFNVGNDNWELTIKDASDTTVLGPIGEAFAGGAGWAGSGINSREVVRLAQNPSASINELSFYEDADTSTFGHANRWTPSSPACPRSQDLRPLRTWISCNCVKAALNEYNAVGETGYLGPGGAGGSEIDTHFGHVVGNGGDWFELLITDDHVDMRGWTLAWEEVADDEQGTITLSNHAVFSNLRAGTVVTFIRNTTAQGGLDTDLSYGPTDRWININTHDAALIAATTSTVGAHGFGDFHTSNDGWKLTLLNASNQPVGMEAGEGAESYAGRGVSNTDVCSLEQDASTATRGWDLYQDNTRSTFGSLNTWKTCPANTFVSQSNATLLASTCVRAADINASGVVNIDDLLAVINSWGACVGLPCLGDVNNNGVVNVDDLLAVINNWG